MSDTVSSYGGVYSPAEMIQVNEIERLRSRNAELEAAIQTHRDTLHPGYVDCGSVPDCEDHALYAVLREDDGGGE